MDVVGKTKSYIFPEETKIEKQSFLILDRQKTKITLNNSGDHLKLFQPNGKIIDEVVFEKALLGQSFNRFETNWKWSSILTPNSVNALPEPKKLVENNPLPILEEDSSPQIKDIAKEKNLASVTAATPKHFSLLLFAFCLSIFSGIIVLFLKKKLKNY